ncbi:MAG: hypothetical protein ABSF63_05390 [Candidatus Bathyarchaeia archaeon]
MTATTACVGGLAPFFLTWLSEGLPSYDLRRIFAIIAYMAIGLYVVMVILQPVNYLQAFVLGAGWESLVPNSIRQIADTSYINQMRKLVEP